MRDAIVDAAKKLLWEQGYQSMSPRKVLDASGAGQGSLYHHFRSKRQLAEAALAEVEAELVASAEAIFSADRPPLERLRAYLFLERDGLKGCRLGRLANEAEVLNTPELQAVLSRYFVRLEALVGAAMAQAQAEGDLNASLAPEQVAAAVIATVQGGFLLSRALNDPHAIARATEGAWTLIESSATPTRKPLRKGSACG